jgi:hypothetical protein
MSLIRKTVFWVVTIALLTGIYAVQDWYRFAKYGEIDPQRGVYGNDHLEVWIDINARMPAPLRKWACKTLLDRETEVTGGVGRAPYGCDADFDPNAKGQAMSAALLDAHLNNATVLATSRNATPEQLAAVKACMQTDFTAKVSPEQLALLDASSPDPATMSIVADLGMAASLGCLKKQGLE